MIRDAELDRILTGWLSEGPEGAPADDVAAALATVATTPQRRRWNGQSGWRLWTRSLPRTRLGLLAAALLILLAAVAIGVGTGLIRLPSWLQDTTPPVPSEATLRPVRIEDWPVELAVPATWAQVQVPCCEIRHFSGSAPEGHLSVGHESPYDTGVCSPECQRIDLPATIPYSAEAQLDALKASVAAIAGSASWTPLDSDVLPQIDGGVRLETTGQVTDGRVWRRVYIVGLRERNVVAIAWSQPDDQFDGALLTSVLASIELTPAPVYSDGDLVRPPPSGSQGSFFIPVPGLWVTSDQPSLDGSPMSGVTRFAEGRVLVSIGDREGTLGWCDVECRQLAGQTTLDALERSIREGRDLGPATSITLGGEPARAMGTDDPVTRRYVVAIHKGRPVALMIDVGDWDVAPGIIDEMIAGFAFTDPVAEPVDQVFTVLDGRATLGLSDVWKPLPGRENEFVWRNQRLSLRVGDADGSILTCELPVADWELCRDVTATDLADLVTAVQPAKTAEHGAPPEPRQDTISLGGEPSVVIRLSGYEYPARGGQEVVYIVAMHDGRPYILRLRTTADKVRDLQSVIEGFQFVD